MGAPTISILAISKPEVILAAKQKTTIAFLIMVNFCLTVFVTSDTEIAKIKRNALLLPLLDFVAEIKLGILIVALTALHVKTTSLSTTALYLEFKNYIEIYNFLSIL